MVSPAPNSFQMFMTSLNERDTIKKRLHKTTFFFLDKEHTRTELTLARPSLCISQNAHKAYLKGLREHLKRKKNNDKEKLILDVHFQQAENMEAYIQQSLGAKY